MFIALQAGQGVVGATAVLFFLAISIEFVERLWYNRVKKGGGFMKKIRVLMCVVIIFGAALCAPACSLHKLGSDSVHFRYFWWEDDNAYYIIETNVEGKTLEDNWEMIDVTIPTEYDGHPVTVIGWDSFRGCQILRSVTIPEGITGIHASSFFDCNHLESVHLPKSMKQFMGACFASCNSLKEVTVDPDNPWFCSVDGVVYTKDQKELVFYPPGKEEAEFVIPEGCTAVGRYAFAYCENLKRIVVPHTVNHITYESILFCKGFEGIEVDEGNQTFASVHGNLYSKDLKRFLRLCVSTENTSLTIPEGVVEIADGAAYYAHNLTAVNLPQSLTSIGAFSFVACDRLTNMTIPENVIFIGSEAFLRCENMSDVVFEQTSGWSIVPQGGKFVSTKALAASQLASPTKAAEYLSDYYSWEWHRENPKTDG